jgi:hypothetical protein
MRDRDRELIAALAEGSLEDETEARALIESSEEARADYEAQRAALEALAEVAPARMTEAEKAALHRDLWTRLTTEKAPPRRAGAWWARWAFAAAALLLVVGVAAVFSRGDFTYLAAEGVEESFEEIGSSLEAPAEATTEAAAREETAETETVERAASTAVDVELLSEVAEQVRAGDLTSSDLNYDVTDETAEDGAACLQEAGLDEHDLVGDIEADNHYLVAVPADEEIGPTTPVFFVDIDTCTVLYVDE